MARDDSNHSARFPSRAQGMPPCVHFIIVRKPFRKIITTVQNRLAEQDQATKVAGFGLGLSKGTSWSSDGSKGLGTWVKDLNLSRCVKNMLSGNDGMFRVFLSSDSPMGHLLASGHFCLVQLPALVGAGYKDLTCQGQPDQITLW